MGRGITHKYAGRPTLPTDKLISNLHLLLRHTHQRQNWEQPLPPISTPALDRTPQNAGQLLRIKTNPPRQNSLNLKATAPYKPVFCLNTRYAEQFFQNYQNSSIEIVQNYQNFLAKNVQNYRNSNRVFVQKSQNSNSFSSCDDNVFQRHP